MGCQASHVVFGGIFLRQKQGWALRAVPLQKWAVVLGRMIGVWKNEKHEQEIASA
jgi:hypothetical protein